jgi:RNA polymerase sigma factor (sigma-70 family)
MLQPEQILKRVLLQNEKTIKKAILNEFKSRETLADVYQDFVIHLDRKLKEKCNDIEFIEFNIFNRGYVYRMAINFCRDILRKNKSNIFKRYDDLDLASNAASFDEITHAKEQELNKFIIDILPLMLDVLNQSERHYLELRYIYGYSIAEIDAIMGRKGSATFIKRAKEKIRKNFKKFDQMKKSYLDAA